MVYSPFRGLPRFRRYNRECEMDTNLIPRFCTFCTSSATTYCVLQYGRTGSERYRYRSRA